jgi:GNAT superfamily N-acetyltransferase
MRTQALDPSRIDILAPLLDESTREGFGFLRRLVEEHASGAVRFDAAGDLLLGVFDGVELVGVGGVTRDPYADADDVGRIRHVYVRRSHRRRGVGAALVRALDEHAQRHFTTLRLRTDTEGASAFYAALGFATLTPGGTATHARILTKGTAARP